MAAMVSLVLAACASPSQKLGSGATNASTGSFISPSPTSIPESDILGTTPTALPDSSPTAFPLRPAPVSPPLAVFVGPSATDHTRYVVSLVRGDGSIAASTEAAMRSNPTLGAPLPLVSVSKTRAYYLDGDAMVRALTPDGRTQPVLQLDANPQVHAAFAVSPDDRRIAIATIDYNAFPPLLRLSVSDIDGAHATEIFSSATLYVWPVGWHSGKLILAVGDASPATAMGGAPNQPWCLPFLGACPADNPYGAVHGYHLVDPATGNRLASLGSDQCKVMGPLSVVGTICKEGAAGGVAGIAPQVVTCQPSETVCLRQADWTGAMTDLSLDETNWIGVLNVSGTRIATCCNSDAVNTSLPLRPYTRVRSSAAPQLWIDDEHLFYQRLYSQAEGVLDVSTLKDLPVNAPGVPIASLPGGF